MLYVQTLGVSATKNYFPRFVFLHKEISVVDENIALKIDDNTFNRDQTFAQAGKKEDIVKKEFTLTGL